VSAILSVREVSMRYGPRAALRDVSFDVAPGELVAIVGPNGAGKTTLLSILAGVQRASAGTVEGPGAEGTVEGPGAQAAVGRAVGSKVGRRGSRRGVGWRIGWGVGWVPQSPAVYSKLSVAENLRLFARLERVADPDGAVTRMLEQTGLSARADERVERLSGGNRQRVNVALGLIADPPALALDEPSSALDPSQRERLWEFVGALARDAGTAVLFSTHHLGEVRAHATRAIVLADGELLFDGAPSELIAANGGDGDFERAFVAFLRERGH
jgi:ABC-2 type transport system ATP-binding protein